MIYKKSHALNEVILFGFLNFWRFLWPWKLTFNEHWTNFSSPFFSLMTYLSYVFLLDASIFTRIDEKKEELKSTLQILLKKITKERKLRNSQTQLTLDNLNIPNIELLKIKLSLKPPLKQNYLLNKTCKKSHLITRTLIALKKFVFHPSNCLVSLRIWVIKSQL